MKPSVSVKNRMPSSSAAPSFESIVAGTVVPNSEHGHAGAVAVGVATFDAIESALEPAAFEARTTKVYVVPLVRPLTNVVVAGGVPFTVLAVCGVAPTYGVTVYDATALP